MKQVTGILVACVLLTSCSYTEGPPRYNTVMGTPRHPELNAVSDEGIPFSAKVAKPADKYDEPLELTAEKPEKLAPEKLAVAPQEANLPAPEKIDASNKVNPARKVPVENLVEQDQTPNSVSIPVVDAQNLNKEGGTMDAKPLSPQLSLEKEATAQFSNKNEYPKLNSVPPAPSNSKEQADLAKKSMQGLENERKISENGRAKLAAENQADMDAEKNAPQPVMDKPINTTKAPVASKAEAFKPMDEVKTEPSKTIKPAEISKPIQVVEPVKSERAVPVENTPQEVKPIQATKPTQEINSAPAIAEVPNVLLSDGVQAVPADIQPVQGGESKNTHMGGHNSSTGLLPDSRYSQRRAGQNSNPNAMYH